MEFWEIRTPEQAWATAVEYAAVSGDGTLTYWRAGGQRGGTMQVTRVSDRWERILSRLLDRTTP